MLHAIQYFLLGSSFMFSAMVAWLFWRKGPDMLSRLVTVLMIVIALGFAKDAFVLAHVGSQTQLSIEMATVVDVVAVPIYAFILVELCNPGRLTRRFIVLLELPFVVLPVMLLIFRKPVFYYIDMALAVVLGLTTAVWATIAIPRYYKYLKATFSYDDNISLKWAQSILWTFFVLLVGWVGSCMYYNPWFDIIYIILALMLWIFICYFTYKHKSVVDELRPLDVTEIVSDRGDQRAEIYGRIRKLIEEERIYLNPMLKLSDIARLAHTNRSYASAYFSSEIGSTFYDHINGLRVKHAMTMLEDSDKRIEEIAEASGFNSRQSFHRVFQAVKKMTPAEYRNNSQNA